MMQARALVELAAAGVAPGVEVIVRREKSGTWTVTWRDDRGAPPRVHRLRDGGGLEPMQPADDPGLPGAGLLREPASLARRLGAAAAEIALVRWRPGSRAVLRLERAGRPALYVKLLTEKAYARALRTLPALRAPDGSMVLARPCVYLARECALATEAVPGRALHEWLREGAAPPLAEVLAALAALARVRGATRVRTIAGEVASARTQVEQGLVLLPALAPLQARLEQIELPEIEPSGTVHGDLHDKQVFLGAGAVHLIDLEGLALGDPLLDAVNLAEHCRLRSLQGTDAGRGERFAVRLWDALGLERVPRAAEYRSLVRARLAGVYGLRPRWHGLAVRLAEEACKGLE